MAIIYTSLLGLAQPVVGTETNTWGTVVNDQITELIEEAVAGGTSLDVTAGDVTLTDTPGAPSSARNAILVVTGTPVGPRNIVAPSKSKSYVVVNKTSQSVVVKGAATTGISVTPGNTSVVVWDGSDFVKGLINLASEVTGTLSVANGGTGLTTTPTNGQIDIGNGTGFTRTTLTAGANISVTNSAGAISIDLSGTVPVSNGGSGANSLTGVLIGNGSSAFSTKTNPSGAFVGTTDTQTLTNKTLTNAVLSGNYTETVFNIVDGPVVDLNPTNGTIQVWTLGGNRAPTAASFSSGQSIVLMVNDGLGFVITWPSVVWVGGSPPALAPTGFTVVVLWKVSTTLYGALVGEVA